MNKTGKTVFLRGENGERKWNVFKTEEKIIIPFIGFSIHVKKSVFASAHLRLVPSSLDERGCLYGEKTILGLILFLALLIPSWSESTPSKKQASPQPQFLVPPPNVIPDKKGLEQQRQQSETFLKWIDPQKSTKAKNLQVHIPDFAEQVHYLVDEKTFTHVPRSSILWIPTEGKAKSFFKSEKEAKTKTFIEPEKFVRDHQNQFEKVELSDGKAPATPENAKDKIVILYSFGKVTVPQK